MVVFVSKFIYSYAPNRYDVHQMVIKWREVKVKAHVRSILI